MNGTRYDQSKFSLTALNEPILRLNVVQMPRTEWRLQVIQFRQLDKLLLPIRKKTLNYIPSLDVSIYREENKIRVNKGFNLIRLVSTTRDLSGSGHTFVNIAERQFNPPQLIFDARSTVTVVATSRMKS
ncbi:hypothetical protein CLV63_1245 [Murinocardiopsis flavida]|uniref:Uncharacterized protein n=1 Tax=Murinocardiopsis flavida TaxID=645275 RepID=A0A2P8CY44_9ACTN|nr:hypothetical protein CLV63_1245 [Murinocardiopsis flavida]